MTYFDTARVYMGGRNEAILAEGLGTRRREVVVATKCASYGSIAAITASCEQSLAALKIDWIDVFQLHGLSSRAQVLAPECLAGLAALKQSGKIRFAGVTTHAGRIEVIDAAIEAGSYDTVLTTFNFREPPGLGEAVRRAAAAGVGVIAMKIMAGGIPIFVSTGAGDRVATALEAYAGVFEGAARSGRNGLVFLSGRDPALGPVTIVGGRHGMSGARSAADAPGVQQRLEAIAAHGGDPALEGAW